MQQQSLSKPFHTFSGHRRTQVEPFLKAVAEKQQKTGR